MVKETGKKNKAGLTTKSGIPTVELTGSEKISLVKVRDLTHSLRALCLFVGIKEEVKILHGKILFDLSSLLKEINERYKELEQKHFTLDEVQTAVDNVFYLTKPPVENFNSKAFVYIALKDFKTIKTYLDTTISLTASEKKLFKIEDVVNENLFQEFKEI